MKGKLTILFMFILVLTACSKNEHFTFEGNTDNWKVVYEVMQQSNNDQSIEFNIAFIGEGEPPQTIDYEFSSVGGGYSAKNFSINEDTNTFMGLKLCTKCIGVVKDLSVNFTVSWNNQSEDIALELK